jgi:hypothetical protein
VFFASLAATPCLGAEAPQAVAGSCTRWVASGRDDGAAGSQQQPWRPIQHAVNNAVPGAVVCVGAGTYREDGELKIAVSGTSAQPITIKASDGAEVTVQAGVTLRRGASHLRLEGFAVSSFPVWGVSLSGDNHHVSLSHLRVSGGEAGVHFTVGDSGRAPEYGPVSHVELVDSVISGSEYTAVDCTPGPCDDMAFRRLEIFGSGIQAGFAGDGLALERGARVVVEDCHVHDNGGDGIDLNSRDVGRDMPGIVVRRNRVGKNGRNGVKLWAGGRMVNNLVWDSGDTALVLEWGTFHIANNTIANISTHNYLALLGNYDVKHPASVHLHNNIFSNDDPAMGGTLVFYPALVTLDADHNLFHNPHREGDVICADFLAGGPCFSSSDIDDGTWAAASGQGQHSRYADPRYVAQAADDYHLAASSPAVGIGATGHAPADDLDGLARDASPDIGAFEYR